MKGVFIVPHKTKASPEEKILLVKKHLNGEISAAMACEIAGIEKSAFQTWLRLYKQEGALGLVTNDRCRVYSQDLKTNAVEAYLSGEGSLSDICIIYKIRSKKQLRDWIKLYNNGKNLNKISGGSRMNKSRKTTLEERIMVAKECIESGLNYGEIAKKYDLDYQLVYTWVKKFIDKGAPGLQDRRGQRRMDQDPLSPEEEAQIKIAKLEHENYLLRMERDLLKKVEELERRDAFHK